MVKSDYANCKSSHFFFLECAKAHFVLYFVICTLVLNLFIFEFELSIWFVLLNESPFSP